jgi:hypothetical protein
MANSPDIHKTQLVLRIERGLKLQVEKKAEQEKITSTALVNRILMEELQHVTLTPADYRKIAEDIEVEQKRRLRLSHRPKTKHATRKNG